MLGGTETILVAEDEEALRNLARDILEGLDYTVEAVKRARSSARRAPGRSVAMVLQKPYNVEGLGRKVREVLDKSR